MYRVVLQLVFILPIFLTSCLKGMPLSILYVGAETTNCLINGIEKQCLRVKWTQDQEEWEVFSEEIKGFSYEPGYMYVLRIRLEDKRRPGADSNSHLYHLSKMIEKQRVCEDYLSEAEVINILNSRGLILKPEGLTEEEIARTPSYAPKTKLDLEKCTWTVVSSTYEPVTYEGDCISTNGCTPEIILTVEVKARNAELLYEAKERVLHPNYE